MKNLITFILAGLISSSAFAQSPERMSYQAVIRDASNTLITSSTIGMQVSILHGSFSGNPVYVETQSPMSNSNGLVSIRIGEGTVTNGDFSSIDWSNGPYFVKTETDPTGGNSYTITGVSELLSVPYALHSKQAETLLADTIDNFIVHVNNGEHSFFDITSTTELYNPVSEQMAIVGVSKDNHNPIDTNDARAFMVHSDAIRNLTKTVVCEPGELTMSVQNDSLAALGLNPFQAVIQMKDLDEEILIGNAYVDPDQQNVISVGGQETTLFYTDDAGITYHAFQFSHEGVKLVEDDIVKFSADLDGTTTINDVLKITPRSTAPASPDKGTIYFDDSTNKLMVFDGTVWQACW